MRQFSAKRTSLTIKGSSDGGLHTCLLAPLHTFALWSVPFPAVHVLESLNCDDSRAASSLIDVNIHLILTPGVIWVPDRMETCCKLFWKPLERIICFFSIQKCTYAHTHACKYTHWHTHKGQDIIMPDMLISPPGWAHKSQGPGQAGTQSCGRWSHCYRLCPADPPPALPPAPTSGNKKSSFSCSGQKSDRRTEQR